MGRMSVGDIKLIEKESRGQNEHENVTRDVISSAPITTSRFAGWARRYKFEVKCLLQSGLIVELRFTVAPCDCEASINQSRAEEPLCGQVPR